MYCYRNNLVLQPPFRKVCAIIDKFCNLQVIALDVYVYVVMASARNIAFQILYILCKYKVVKIILEFL